MTVENCNTESPSTYEASAPAASSYTRPQAATTNTDASSATSIGRGAPLLAITGVVMRIRRPAAAARSMNRRGHDDADAPRHRRDHQPERHVVLFHQLVPEVVRRELVEHQEAQPEDHHADQRVDDGAEHDCRFQP